MVTPIRCLLLFCLAVLAGPLIPGAQTLAADTPIPHIRNGGAPSGGVHTLHLQEMWRVGGDDDEDHVFGQITRVRADAQGNVFLLDSQLQKVSIFSPGGEYLRTIFGEGDGPGELRWGCDFLFLPGDRIGAVRRFPASLVAVDRQGDPASGSFASTTPGHSFAGGNFAGGNLVMAGSRSDQGEKPGTQTRHSFLASYTAEGEPLVEYHHTDRWIDYQHNFVFNEKEAINDFLYAFAVGQDGRVFVLPDRDRYAISVFHADGRPDRIIEREFTPRRRTARERDRMEALAERRFRTFPFELNLEFSDTESVIAWYHRGLQVTPDGSLWVRHCRSAENLPEGVLVRFDVFDREGTFIRQADVPAPGDPLLDGVFLVGEDRLVVVHGFVDSMRSMVGGGQGPLTEEGYEPRPVEVICYRITS